MKKILLVTVLSAGIMGGGTVQNTEALSPWNNNKQVVAQMNSTFGDNWKDDFQISGEKDRQKKGLKGVALNNAALTGHASCWLLWFNVHTDYLAHVKNSRNEARKYFVSLEEYADRISHAQRLSRLDSKKKEVIEKHSIAMTFFSDIEKFLKDTYTEYKNSSLDSSKELNFAMITSIIYSIYNDTVKTLDYLKRSDGPISKADNSTDVYKHVSFLLEKYQEVADKTAYVKDIYDEMQKNAELKKEAEAKLAEDQKKAEEEVAKEQSESETAEESGEGDSDTE